jgi:hypothetical protein
MRMWHSESVNLAAFAPRRFWWYVVAALIVVGGWLGSVVYTAGAWNVVRDSPVTPVGRAFDAQGKHVGVLTDLPQPDRGITCLAVGPGKGHKTEIPPAPVDVSVDRDGVRWYLIALMEDGRKGMKVSCAPTDKRVDSAVYGYQVIGSIGDRAGMGRVLAWGGVLLGGALAALTAWNRRGRSLAV